MLIKEEIQNVELCSSKPHEDWFNGIGTALHSPDSPNHGKESSYRDDSLMPIPDPFVDSKYIKIKVSVYNPSRNFR